MRWAELAQPCQVRGKPPPSEVQHPPTYTTPKPSPVPLSTAHSLAGVPHTPLATGPSAGSRRKETSA